MRNFDLQVFQYIRSFVGMTDTLDFFGIFCASILLPIMFAALLFGARFMRRRDHVSPREIVIHALCAAGLGFFMREIIGVLYYRLRPFLTHSFEPLIQLSFVDGSFPSGHATAAFALATIVLKYDALWGIIFALFAGLVAWGRVYVGVHYPSDVIAGAILGVLSARAIEWIEHYEWSNIGHRLRSLR